MAEEYRIKIFDSAAARMQQTKPEKRAPNYVYRLLDHINKRGLRKFLLNIEGKTLKEILRSKSNPDNLDHLLYALMALAPLIVWLIDTVSSTQRYIYADSAEAKWALAATVVCSLIAGIAHKWKTEQYSLIQGSLEKSRLAIKLAEGPDEILKIREYTPAPFRNSMLGKSRSDIDSCARIMARHLNWYLKAPHTYVSMEWVFGLLIPLPALLILLESTQVIGNPDGLFPTLMLTLVLINLLIALVWAHVLHNTNEEYFYAYLCDYYKI